MEPTGTSFLTHNCDGQAASTQHDARETVVWLRGKHDASTVAALSATLAKAISLGHPDLVVDLSGVQYLGAATVSLIIQNAEYLRLRSRSLTLRNPTTCSRRVLAVCDLSDLIDPEGLRPPRQSVNRDSAIVAIGVERRSSNATTPSKIRSLQPSQSDSEPRLHPHSR